MPWLTPKPAPLATPGPSVQPVPAYPGGGSFPFGSGFAIASDIENLSDSSINPFPSTVSPVLFGPAFSPIEDITLPQLDILKPTDTTSFDITKPMVESTQVDEPPSWSILLLGLLLLIVMRNVRWRIFGLRL
jgi:hypothetical protein